MGRRGCRVHRRLLGGIPDEGKGTSSFKHRRQKDCDECAAQGRHADVRHGSESQRIREGALGYIDGLVHNQLPGSGR